MRSHPWSAVALHMSAQFGKGLMDRLRQIEPTRKKLLNVSVRHTLMRGLRGTDLTRLKCADAGERYSARAKRWNEKEDALQISVIRLWPIISKCAMCGVEGDHNHAVGFCCEPTRDEIGSESSTYPGHVVGGADVCQPCHDRFYGIGQ